MSTVPSATAPGLRSLVRSSGICPECGKDIELNAKPAAPVVRLSGENVYGESTCIWVRVDLVQAVYRALDDDNITCTAIEMQGSTEDTFQLYGVSPDDIAAQLGWTGPTVGPLKTSDKVVISDEQQEQLKWLSEHWHEMAPQDVLDQLIADDWKASAYLRGSEPNA